MKPTIAQAVLVAGLVCLPPTCAYANDFALLAPPGSHFLVLYFALWFFVGRSLRKLRPELVLFGQRSWPRKPPPQDSAAEDEQQRLRRERQAIALVGVVFFGVAMYLLFLPLLMIWLILLAMLTIYYVFPRPGVPRTKAWFNALYHGAFLLAVIVTGFWSEKAYWADQGGIGYWLALLREYYPGFAIFTSVLATVVLLHLHFGEFRAEKTSATVPERKQS